jgi:hypothetical protein
MAHYRPGSARRSKAGSEMTSRYISAACKKLSRVRMESTDPGDSSGHRRKKHKNRREKNGEKGGAATLFRVHAKEHERWLVAPTSAYTYPGNSNESQSAREWVDSMPQTLNTKPWSLNH